MWPTVVGAAILIAGVTALSGSFRGSGGAPHTEVSAASPAVSVVVGMGECGVGSLPREEGRSHRGVALTLMGPSRTRVGMTEFFRVSLTTSEELTTYLGPTTAYLVSDGRVVATSTARPAGRYAKITPTLPDEVGGALTFMPCQPSGGALEELPLGRYEVVAVVDIDGRPVRTRSAALSLEGPPPQPSGRTATLHWAGTPIGDCDRAVAFAGTVAQEGDLLTAALDALFAGVRPDAPAHARSFSPDTAGMLRAAHVRDGVAYIDLHADVFPGTASTSTGSCIFEATAGATVRAASDAEIVRYALDGDPARYTSVMQRSCPEPSTAGDVCDAAAFIP